MLGEDRLGDDEVFGFTNKGPWIKCGELYSQFHNREVGPQHNLSRTTRPIPFTLTKEQIADGWIPWSGGECPVEPESQPGVVFKNTLTFLSTYAKKWRWTHIGDCEDIIAYKPVPYGHLRQALSDGKVIQVQWSRDKGSDKWHDCIPDWSMPADQYRIKPEPQWLPLGPVDVPPGSVFRQSETTASCPWYSVLCIHDLGVCFHAGGKDAFTLTYAELERLPWQINRPRHRDADGNPTLWEPCRKPSAV